MREGIKISSQLLVEGNDDLHVILALCQKFELLQNFEIINCNGVENLYSQVPVRFKQSEINIIGIIIDADNDILSRWIPLKNLLTFQGFNIPDVLPKEGLILENEIGKKIGVWIMPNNNLNGMLEDFINFLVPKDDKLLPMVRSTLDHIEKEKLNKYSLIHKSKAIIHTWLSWQEDPGTPMGLAITKKYLTTDEQNCLIFTNWLKALFNH